MTRNMTILASLLLCSSAMAFDRVPPKPAFDIDNGIFLECAIVKHSADQGRNPAYKIQVSIRADQGKFQGLDVFYTMQSGQVFNRTEQHPDGTTWTSMPKSYDWFWAGDRNPTEHSQVGHLYHNRRDGWVYTEDIPKHHGGYHMTAIVTRATLRKRIDHKLRCFRHAIKHGTGATNNDNKFDLSSCANSRDLLPVSAQTVDEGTTTTERGKTVCEIGQVSERSSTTCAGCCRR